MPPYVADTPKSRKDYALYYDEITRLDRFVGEVMAELEKQGVADNTFVLFISDNGRPFPRDKPTLYDSGIRTPFIVHWPGRFQPGGKSDSLVSSVDIGPAFLELAGLSTPTVFEGRSFLPLLRNPKLTLHDFVFAERNWHDYEDRVRAVRNKRFKYIRNFYYDLPNTPPADVVRSIAYREMIRLRDEGKLADAQKNTFIQPRPRRSLRHQKRSVRTAKPRGRLRAGQAAEAVPPRPGQVAGGDERHRAPFRTLDEFGREDGQALPVRERPRPDKVEMTRRPRTLPQRSQVAWPKRKSAGQAGCFAEGSPHL